MKTTKRITTPSRHQQKNRSVLRSLQESDSFKSLINESVRRAVEKQKAKCESEKTIGEMIAEDRKAMAAEQDFEFIIEFDVAGDAPNKLLRDTDGDLFIAYQNIGGPLIDLQLVTLREAFSWFAERYRYVDGFSGEVADLMELAVPYLPQAKQNRKLHAQHELPSLK